MKISILLCLLDDNNNLLSDAGASVDISNHDYEYRLMHDDICAVTWDLMREVIDNREISTDIEPVDMPIDNTIAHECDCVQLYMPPKGDLT